ELFRTQEALSSLLDSQTDVHTVNPGLSACQIGQATQYAFVNTQRGCRVGVAAHHDVLVLAEADDFDVAYGSGGGCVVGNHYQLTVLNSEAVIGAVTVDADDIQLGAAVDGVIAFAGNDGVVACAGADAVVALAAGHTVVAAGSHECVVTIAAVKRGVLVAVNSDLVIAVTAGNHAFHRVEGD